MVSPLAVIALVVLPAVLTFSLLGVPGIAYCTLPPFPCWQAAMLGYTRLPFLCWLAARHGAGFLCWFLTS